jgi:3',5'-cyclic AMP phosphodiesterase CpdA
MVQTPPVTGQRIGVLADTQMSPHIAEMFPLMAARPVDFWVHGGDVTDVINPTGWQGSDDANWQWTIHRLAELGKPVYCVPGNHDLVRAGGNHEAGPANPALLAKWAQYVGPLRFVVETDYSRFVGFNYLDWSSENQAWLEAQLDTAKRRVVIQHYPLGGVDPGWYDARGLDKRFFFADKGVDLFLTGHRHAFIASRESGSTYVVCPSVFDVVAPHLPDPVPYGGLFPMSYACRGWLELVDSAEQLVIEFWRWDGLKTWVFGV